VWHGDIIRLLCRRQKITEAAAQNRNPVLNAGEFTRNLKFVFENCFFRMKVAKTGIVLEFQCWIKKGRAVVTTAALLKMVCINLMKT
jgi:hypothetical protein